MNLEDLNKQQKKSIRLRWRIIGSTVIILAVIVCLCIVKVNSRNERLERERIEYERQRAAYRQEQLRLKAINDSIRVVNEARAKTIRDSIALANRPAYTDEDVVKMVKAKVPSYSDIYLWSSNKDNWIMHYSREYGGKSHDFMRRFNPTKRTFEKEVEVSSRPAPGPYIGECDRTYYFIPKSHNRYVKTTSGILYYIADEKTVDVWRKADNIHYIRATTQSPLSKRINSQYIDHDFEGYEDWEDYFYDNEEDLRFFYGY